MVAKFRVSYIFALVWGTVIWWSAKDQWPSKWVDEPLFDSGNIFTFKL